LTKSWLLMSINQKKLRERVVVDTFRNLCADAPSGLLSDGEAPDFLLTTPTGRLGLEIVEFVRGHGRHGSAQRQGERFRLSVARTSQQLYESHSDATVQVLLTWLSATKVNAKVAFLAPIICGLVAKNTPLRVYDEHRIDGVALEAAMIAAYIQSISVVRLRPGSNSLWDSWDVGWLGTDPTEFARPAAVWCGRS
jgi:hypothetical protein